MSIGLVIEGELLKKIKKTNNKIKNYIIDIK